ncbi:MAG: hypothetical protein IJF67_13485 [Clostridia bacterium]|nr:hypothetical protein [Clostridia bacterium]
MKSTRTISFALAALLAVGASVSACGGSGTSADTTAASGDTTTADTEAAYVYPDVDLGGEEFTILNTAQTYGFYSALDFEEQTGDALDDAIYARNRKVEEQFNLNIVVNEEYQLTKANDALSTAVLAGDDVYDVAFLRELSSTAQLTEGMFLDLQEIDNFNFDEPWWDVQANESVRIGDKKSMFYAYTDISFADFEGALCVFFNEDMMADLNLAFPYDLVREGKWTLDELGKLMKAGANLNGQDNYTWKDDGTATYGLASWDQACYGLFMASGFNFIEADKDGMPTIVPFGDAYITQMQKIISMFSVDGEYYHATGSNGTKHYEDVFKLGKTLTMIAQLKATNKYRDMEASFGIVPMPKKDAAQENYRCLRSFSYVMAVPVTNSIQAETGAIMDAMGYINYTDVMDTFYNGRVSQKSLRNEDSVEMLGIIRDSRVIDLGIAYGWSTNLRNTMLKGVTGKSTDVMSTLESHRSAIETSIKTVMEKLNDN